MNNKINLLLFIVSVVNVSCIKSMDETAVRVQAEITKCLEKLPARVRVCTYQGQASDGTFSLDASIACQSGILRKACLQGFLIYKVENGGLMHTVHHYRDSNSDGNFDFYDVNADQWRALQAFLPLSHNNKTDEMRRALATLNATQIADVVTLAQELEIPAVVESAGTLLQQSFVQPEEFVTTRNSIAQCGHSVAQSIALFKLFPIKKSVDAWLSCPRKFTLNKLIGAMELSSDGSKIAMMGHCDKSIVIRDAQTGERVSTLSESGNCYCNYFKGFFWSHCGKKIVTYGESTVRVWDVFSGNCSVTFEAMQNDCHVQSVAWNHDDSKIAIGKEDGSVGIFDAMTGQMLLIIDALVFGHCINNLAWSSDDNSIVVSVGGSSRAALIDLQTLECGQTFASSRSRSGCMAWSNDCSKIALVAINAGTVTVYDAHTKMVMCTINDIDMHSVQQLTWSSDDSKIVIAHYAGAGIWDAQTGEAITSLVGSHLLNCTSFAWSPDGTKVAGGIADHCAFIWDAQTGAKIATVPAYKLGFCEYTDQLLQWTPDSKQLITKSDQNTVSFWTVELEQQLQSLTLDQGLFLSAFYECHKKQDGSTVLVCLRCKPQLHALYHSLCPEIQRKIDDYIPNACLTCID